MHFTPAIEPFAASDLIRVADGPLRLRSDAGPEAAILTKLANGTTVCMLEGPVARTEGAHDDALLGWYRVRANADDGGTEGWLAGRYCTLAAKIRLRKLIGSRLARASIARAGRPSPQSESSSQAVRAKTV